MSSTTADQTTQYSAFNGTWTLDQTHTRLGFTARHAMVTKVRGTFTSFQGELTIDASSPEQSSATVTVEMSSVDTGTADRDAHLKSPDFFDVEKFPTMSFNSDTVTRDGDAFVLAGTLTIKDTTKPVRFTIEPTAVVTDPFGNVRAGFEGSAEISRQDFGLTWNVPLDSGGWLVSDKIKIDLDVSAIKSA